MDPKDLREVSSAYLRRRDRAALRWLRSEIHGRWRARRSGQAKWGSQASSLRSRLAHRGALIRAIGRRSGCCLTNSSVGALLGNFPHALVRKCGRTVETTNIAMLNSAQAMRLRTAVFPGIINANKAIVGLSYVAAYVTLDWVSFIEPYAHFDITPWNPNTGLSFIVILVFGQRMIPFLFISPFLADLVNREIVVPWSVEILSVGVIGGGYSTALAFLKRSTTRFDPALPTMRDMVALILVTAVGAAFVSSSYVGLRIAAELLPAKDFMTATLRYWIGDVIGVLGLTPFALFALTRRRILPISIETGLQCAAIIGALMMVFGLSEEREFQLFYVLFLPIIWMAVRDGAEGVSVGILITQIGVILGGAFFEESEELIAFQALALVLTVTGLIAGQLVTERRRAEFQLRLHRESLARLTRLGSMGELAAGVAHEVNQPLTAAGVYMRLVADSISSGKADTAEVAEIVRKAVAQVDRAGEVIRHLRALVRLDRSNRTSFSLDRIVKQTIELCQPDLDRANIITRYRPIGELPLVMVDTLQIEQVLHNLVRNSVEAISNSGSRHGSILIESKPASNEFVEVRLLDSGPGFPREQIENGFLPLSSTKPEGLGIGLPLCKSIVEAHGGRLWLDQGPYGTSVHFTLPVTI
jgi:two-component system sensor kinase FixL